MDIVNAASECTGQNRSSSCIVLSTIASSAILARRRAPWR
jgi:hypothetical protein